MAGVRRTWVRWRLGNGILLKPYDQLEPDEKLQLLELLMDNVQDSIVLADTSGRLFYVNAGWEEMTGWSYDESIGKTPKELLASGVHAPGFLSNADQALASGETWQGRLVSRRRDGELFTQWATVVPVLDKSNQVTRYVGIRRDISATEEKDEALAAS